MAYTVQVTIDSVDPHRLADCWAAALGWSVEPADPDLIRRLIAAGHATEDDTVRYDGSTVWRVGAAIVHPAGTERAPRILFHRVPEPKTVKNRVHLDVRVGAETIDAEVQRLETTGAVALHRGQLGRLGGSPSPIRRATRRASRTDVREPLGLLRPMRMAVTTAKR